MQIKNLPQVQLPLLYYSFQPGDILFSPRNLAMVHQLPGSQAETKVKQLLVSRFQLLYQFF